MIFFRKFFIYSLSSVFYNLSKLNAGDEVLVSDDQAKVYKYVVTKKENYLRIKKSAETVKQRKAAHNLRCANMHTNRSHYT